MGSGIHCVGCGRLFGVTCVVVSEDYVYPEKKPDWPFDEDDCPVCGEMKIDIIEMTTTEVLRKEIEKRKKKVGMKWDGITSKSS